MRLMPGANGEANAHVPFLSFHCARMYAHAILADIEIEARLSKKRISGSSSKGHHLSLLGGTYST